ncbi:MAG: SAM-dependent methyltransferase [Burkholderiaceae bacterium]|nr:SAM-dependent methyltransferase [Burkholderiaceae bacterium]
MTTLTRELRRSLENTVREARRTAEAGARKVIEQLAVHHHEPWPSMTPAQRELRNRLRAHGRQLGDRRDEQRGLQAIDRLSAECAYEHWHRLLFARFLAETELLIEPQSRIAISLSECEELAHDAGRDWLEVAAEYAQRMLPQIFRNGDPVLEVALPPETRSAIEDLMKALPRDVFVAADSLGWVYQFWQADRKEDINQSAKKIGAEELPAVTQFFTEDYMVFFVLHNTLGAWWAGKVLAASPTLANSSAEEVELRAACAVGDVEWTYLRFVREKEGPWRPAAGTFEGWPEAAKDITLLDPCMGSGHFLVFALPMLAAMRASEEGMSPEAATLAVLRDNLFGLEIDPRCTQIAAFNLALAAWRRVGYRALEMPHLACSGLSLGVTKTEWFKLAQQVAQASPVPPKIDLLGAEDNLFSDAMRRGFDRLYDLFARAPWIGSLIDPHRTGKDLIEQGFADLEPLLAAVLARAESAEITEMAVAAQGLAKATEILAARFTLVATNVPYLGRGKQDDVLKDYCERVHPEAKTDLATCFIERCLAFCAHGGSTTLVSQQNWWYLTSYRGFRKTLLAASASIFLPRLEKKPGRRSRIEGLLQRSSSSARANRWGHAMAAIDALRMPTIEAKVQELRRGEVQLLSQEGQFGNPDHRITMSLSGAGTLLQEHARAFQGIASADYAKFGRFFWEFAAKPAIWEFQQSTVASEIPFAGREHVLQWEDGRGELARSGQARVQGLEALGRWGVAVSQMRNLPTTIYTGELFDNNCAAMVTGTKAEALALWTYCESGEFKSAVRRIDRSPKVTNATLVKVPFDLAYWQKVAEERYPQGMPVPASNDPTQWLFNGHPSASDHPLQVAVARLLGYQWPRQTGSKFLDCPALEMDGLEKCADHDGIAALSPVKGEQSAAARLTTLLSDALRGEWSATRLNSMLEGVGYRGKSLDDWLRDGFFEQHCALFHQRPFILHIWDGRRDGFHALVNYPRLVAPNGEGKRTLEKILFSYLGDWIDRQHADQITGVEGADARVAAAEQLKTELTRMLDGEPPYDIFVRWKPLHLQPLGWEPDVNDGLRMNIRPFMFAKPLGARARGACVLRTTPKITWDKDRGIESERKRGDFPWFWNWDGRATDFEGRGKEPDGIRWNDLHYTRAFKQAARDRRSKR